MAEDTTTTAATTTTTTTTPATGPANAPGPVEQLAVILPMLTNVVGRIEPSQFDLPSPCAAFSVRGVMDHMIGGAESFAPAFRGVPAGSPPPGDDTGGRGSGRDAPIHPAPRFRAAMADLLHAVHDPDAMARQVDAPFGTVDGDTFARFFAFDGLVHGWDLATSTGQAYDPPEDLVAAVDAFARQALAPEMRDGDTFAVEAEPPTGATALERLVAFSGRTLRARPT